jgi:SNF2 family DNA or RNA helicase
LADLFSFITFQNDLNELWALLNLLLPDVFDNSRQFNEWFHSPFAQKDGTGKADEEDWLEKEKKIIVIHRLHQILEPFMLRYESASRPEPNAEQKLVAISSSGAEHGVCMLLSSRFHMLAG